MKENTLSRKEQGKLTKEKIFKTAVNLITEKGYDNISVNEICNQAGVAKGTFYVHYKSKEDIVRESYYLDMGEFVLSKFDEYIKENESISIKDKVIKFLLLEFEFTKYIGYEMTCLAFVTNISECIPGPCRHFERRTFTNLLKDMMIEAQNEGKLKLGNEDAFLYLETFVRGMMASWCFANGEFDILEKGKEYIKKIIDSVF